ncbi:MAG: hydroxyacid dehydrogenase [Elusimicrobia bacterium RIFOXYA12_FULL_51_18]|nr:MAG: hydroxyacid dehydrogenase [Elusimicrobia bacterium RIFOXYA12_FULL_51_18]OGS29028.1 MAG: hydroxyacid dehydrogenase [Elusimicrobia bacterium RIFOXYA2_FULL_53_38]
MTKNFPEKAPNQSGILFYQTEDGQSRLQVRFADKTVWLSQIQIAELFQTSKQNISLHINNVLEEQELSETATVKEYLTVQNEGGRQVQRRIVFYNLDMILAVGYRVKSPRGTQFRRWATERLREYLIKGFVMDDERLKNPKEFGADYFDELLERIRDIRASEKRFYQKVRDIYSLAVDYDPNAAETQEFFQIVQNKLHWAITGKTAPEIIHERADARKDNMGLTSWKAGKVRKADVTIAKNYLNTDEIKKLDRLVTMYLDFAEERAEEGVPLYMKDWRSLLDEFLKFNRKAILSNAGKVKKEIAEAFALKQYEIFHSARIHREDIVAQEAEMEELENQVKKLEHKPKRKKRDE